MRDCTVQRDHQKLIEESSSQKLPKELYDDVMRYGEAIANEIDYVGAGTIEFIFDRKENRVYFMEMNTRLQVEHPVTELTSGVDIVREQIRIAEGESIQELKIAAKGYAMEVRINADRLVAGAQGKVSFAPSPGRITKLRLPEAPGIRTLSAVSEGDQIPPYYDSLIVQVIAHGRSRSAVIKSLRAYLEQVEIEGVYTNLALMEAILDDPVFREGDYDTNFIVDFFRRVDLPLLLQRMENRTGGAYGGFDLDAIRIENSDELKVLSPRTGVFYNAPTPDDPPFVEIGGTLDVNAPLCLLEAMKVFENVTLSDYNKTDGQVLFTPECKFTVTRILAESGQTVNQGDLLFIVKPIGSAETASAAGEPEAPRTTLMRK
jgi:acetyl/propionyl-CoA carboxylase alpha subunit